MKMTLSWLPGSVVLVFYFTETLPYVSLFFKIPLTGLFQARSDLERMVGWFLTPMMAAGGASWAAVLKADSVSILAGSE